MYRVDRGYRGGVGARLQALAAAAAVSAGLCASVAAQADAPGADRARAHQAGAAERQPSQDPPSATMQPAAANGATSSQAISVYVTPAE